MNFRRDRVGKDNSLATRESRTQSVRRTIQILPMEGLRPTRFRRANQLRPLPFQIYPTQRRHRSLFRQHLSHPINVRRRSSPLHVSHRRPRVPNDRDRPTRHRHVHGSNNVRHRNILMTFNSRSRPPLPCHLPHPIRHVGRPTLTVSQANQQISVLNSLLAVHPPTNHGHRRPSLLIPSQRSRPQPRLPMVHQRFQEDSPRPRGTMHLPRDLIFQRMELRRKNRRAVNNTGHPGKRLEVSGERLIIAIFVYHFIQKTNYPLSNHPLSIHPFLLPYVVICYPLPAIGQVPFHRRSRHFHGQASLSLLRRDRRISTFTTDRAFRGLFSQVSIRQEVLIYVREARTSVSHATTLRQRVNDRRFLSHNRPGSSLFRQVTSRGGQFSWSEGHIVRAL